MLLDGQMEKLLKELGEAVERKQEEDLAEVMRSKASPRGWFSRLMWRFMRWDISEGLGIAMNAGPRGGKLGRPGHELADEVKVELDAACRTVLVYGHGVIAYSGTVHAEDGRKALALHDITIPLSVWDILVRKFRAG